jgi:hypothetical protein
VYTFDLANQPHMVQVWFTRSSIHCECLGPLFLPCNPHTVLHKTPAKGGVAVALPAPVREITDRVSHLRDCSY